MAAPAVRAPWPTAEYELDAARLGTAIYVLLNTERRWVHRRVEVVDVLDHERVRRRLSVDMTIPDRIASRIKLTHYRNHVVPLAVLRKAPLRNFDCRLGPTPVPILGRAANSRIAQGVLLTAAERALARANLPAPSASLSERLHSIARLDEAHAAATVEEMRRAADAGDVELATVLDDPRSALMIRTLSANYLLLAEVADVTGRQILKFAYDDHVRTLEADAATSPSLAERLGWRSRFVSIEVPSATRAASYHVEVAVPEEVRVDGAILFDEYSDAIYGIDVDADRAAIIAENVPRGGSPLLLVGIVAERAGLPTVAFVVAGLTTLLLAAGAWLFKVPDPGQAGPPITVLLAGSALFAGVVARPGEHRFLQATFAWPRRLLFLVALCALAAAAVLGFGGEESTIRCVWRVATVVCGLATLGLGLMFRNARPPRKD